MAAACKRPKMVVVMNPKLLDRLSRMVPSLPRSEQRVARLMLAEPQAFAQRSLGQIAELAFVSKTSVVRMCRSMGFSGFLELRACLCAPQASARAPAMDVPTHASDASTTGDWPRCHETRAWRELRELRDLRQWHPIALPGASIGEHRLHAPGMRVDLSGDLVPREALPLLWSLATACGVGHRRSGVPVRQVFDAGRAFARSIRVDPVITDIVQIADSPAARHGTALVADALGGPAPSGRRFHFAGDASGRELATALAKLRPATTLIVLMSNLQTMASRVNAVMAGEWFARAGETPPAGHLVALTCAAAEAARLGFEPCMPLQPQGGVNALLWSGIGLVAALTAGEQASRELLAGAQAMDRHALQAPLAGNLPMQLALRDLWHRHFLGLPGPHVSVRHPALRELPAYLCPPEAQMHARESQRLPIECFAVRGFAGDEPLPAQPPHAGAMTQAQGPASETACGAGATDPLRAGASHCFVLDDLRASSLGALLALHEHRVACNRLLWGLDDRHADPDEPGTSAAPARHSEVDSSAVLLPA